MQLLLFIAAIILFYLLLKPLLIIFLASIILTYIFYPVHTRIRKLLKHENLSILITLVLIILIFLLPFVFVASQIPKQTSSIYNYAKENIVGKGFFDISCENVNSVKCNTVNFVSGSGYFDFDEIVDSIFKKITEFATYLVVRIPNTIVGLALALFISFFLFKDGKRLVSNITEILPLNQKHSNKLVEQFGRVTYSVVFAHIIVAIAQGVLGAIGFYIFGIESAVFWGVVMTIFALLPLIGPAIIWVPAAAFLLINGIITNSYWSMGMGIGLFLYGILIISISDNLLRIKLVGGRADVHPLTVLVGIIGGINLFGLIGIFIGPIALSLLITFFKDFSGTYR
jgi:predicted PurR-regulated permease PerM